LANGVVTNISTKLHLTTNGHGIIFSIPISHMQGISLRQQQIFEHELEEKKIHLP